VVISSTSTIQWKNMASDASQQLFALSGIDAAVRSSNEGGVEALVRGLRQIAVGSGLSLPQGGPAAADRDAPARRHAPISLRKFLPFAQRLISRVASDHLSLMSERDRAEAFDCFFDGRAFPQVVQNHCFSPLHRLSASPPRREWGPGFVSTHCPFRCRWLFQPCMHSSVRLVQTQTTSRCSR
jgi:hypothetical protein